MTLHPWPLNDSSTRDGVAMLWTSPHGRGLLTDSLAVPLCFLPDEPSNAPTLAATVKPSLRTVTFDTSALLRVRDFSCRFGTSA